MKTNFHTHSNYCDGVASVQEMVLSAINHDVKQLGFSSHAPIQFPVEWSLTNDAEMKHYVDEIHVMKKNYFDKIEIFTGIEADYIPKMTKNFGDLKKDFHLDYVIGSVHLVFCNEQLWFIDGKRSNFDKGIEQIFQGDAVRAAKQYFFQLKQMIQEQQFDIIAHLDKIKMNNAGRYFSENELWYRKELSEILVLLKEKDIILEVNTRGYYQKKTIDMYPSDFVISEAAARKIPMMINSDAHKPEEMCMGFVQAEEILRAYGVRTKIIRKEGQWVETEL